MFSSVGICEISKMVRRSIRFGCRIFHAVSGIVIGVSAAAAFGPVLKNPDAAAFGLFSGKFINIFYCIT